MYDYQQDPLEGKRPSKFSTLTSEDWADAISKFIGIVVLFVIGGFVYTQFTKPVEEVSGVVTYDSCVRKILLDKDGYLKAHGTFICNDPKTNSGVSMGGECVKVETNDNNQCETAFIYEKPAGATCTEHSYLTVNDKCTCDYGYNSVDGDSCTEIPTTTNDFGHFFQ